MNKLKWLIFAIVVFTAAACEKGLIPVLITDIDSVSLPPFTPRESTGTYSVYGTHATRVNAEDLRLKYQYNTSDDVTHIILGGEIANGIPEGLLWNEDSDIDAGGSFGVPAGAYSGRGDFKIGTLGASTGGSAAIGSPDFDSEWVMGGFYTAVVLNGIIENTAGGVTVTETNESLRLFSKTYRDSYYQAIFSDASGKMQKKNTYTYNPNRFRKYPDPPTGQNPTDGVLRGGYYILVSSKANPRTAFLEVEYADGSKKRIEIDYSEVDFRPVPLTGLALQNPSPATNNGGTYSIATDNDSPESSGLYVTYKVDEVIHAGSISVVGSSIPKPLYLRPLYTPVSIDPKKTTTNMISKIYAKAFDEIGNGVTLDPKLVLAWNDPYQAINVYYKASPDSESPGTIGVYANLREPFNGGTVGMFCKIILIMPDTP
ncbi:MAG: hypothetical protein LBK66_11190 [Spirochaetaceae bacterium]|jgi:hypothetical protein|nr:hypothetical protein [Spirochaetaceae bacterium]